MFEVRLFVKIVAPFFTYRKFLSCYFCTRVLLGQKSLPNLTVRASVYDLRKPFFSLVFLI